MSENRLQPGLMAIHGNHPEDLRDVLVSWMASNPLAGLENELILVQSNGIGQWLKLALARDPREGGCGVAAALDIQLPSRFFWQAYRAVLGHDQVPETSPFDKSLLVWRLLRLLPDLLTQPEFAALARFLHQDTDLRKHYQLAERLADLFDQYQVYRADWLADWTAGRDLLTSHRRGVEPLPEEQRWQPLLWRALLEDIGEALSGTSRAALHQRFLDELKRRGDSERPAGLPSRVVVFGISSLSQQALELLAAIGRWTQVFMCVHNPCRHYWGDIIADKDLLRAERARQRRKPGMPDVLALEELHQHAHPLLAAWGKQGRDYIGLLDEYDQHEQYEALVQPLILRTDMFNGNDNDSLLHQLQDDILELRPLAESSARWPAVDPQRDRSIRFHLAHSPQREVEVLHDQLLAAFAADPTLRPRDVIVMVPDINGYAPHIQAVFGLVDRQDPRYIPFSVADRGSRQNNLLLAALEKLLHLPQSRVAVSDVLDLLEVPAVRRRFAIDDEHLPLLQRWIRAANVRWGLHARQRQSLDLPDAPEQNSWFFGLRRMLLGYAVGAGSAWRDIEPLDEVGGLDAVLAGQLALLLDRLDSSWQQLCQPATPSQWGERLRALLSTFFAADEGEDGFMLLQLDDGLQSWLEACESVALDQALPLSVVREHWLGLFEQSSLTQPFFAGTVIFATLMPMRAIPFRHVCLLGMNDGDYPRSRVPLDFDLMGQDYRPGDRSRREDDRYLFLEALLSAREQFYISWVGRSIHDNSERPPSVLVAQLRDHLSNGWRAVDGQDVLPALTVEHRLQPFSADYFTADSPLFSYAREWRAGLVAQDTPSTEAALSEHQQDGVLTLRQLADFIRDPVRSFFRLRLNVWFELEDPTSQDQEPFAIDALENWRLQHELIQEQKAALHRQTPREQALAAQLERIARRGELAPGGFTSVLAQELAEPMADLFTRYAQEQEKWPRPLPDEALSPPDLPLEDWLNELRADEQGNRCRLVLESGGLLHPVRRSYRLDKLLPFWVTHLAGHLDGLPLHSTLVSKNGTVHLPALMPEQAKAYWQTLMEAWQAGMRYPLPLAVKTGFCWLEAGGEPDQPPDGEAGKAARQCYEDHDPDNRKFAESASNPYLARAFPTFEHLWADGAFARWAQQLLAPLYLTLKAASAKQKKSGGQS
ncbi:exodeoxyribonuclease V, gamma subunit [Dickeya chrysanthemi Ech1591]|uniref:RecBCD enzyme subunit RecC n=1 Tax=Dickeya chrysanthemi (strain Ech1591) TaxID=561229 RepID=C6CHG9_DICC1|nr:exodeoxyribonuclease V subunit gamma [Dickeya chrysanthemi]ACT06870.1 exodeoxyribonuclease V, gamma subunit [Dickeya chrysanthemi Ech1591]